jgi:glucose-6-phosphate-specific signal transduction histidine kinase
MADGEGSSNTGVVAIVVIFLIVVIAAFFAWRGGLFGGKTNKVDINVSAPSAPATK